MKIAKDRAGDSGETSSSCEGRGEQGPPGVRALKARLFGRSQSNHSRGLTTYFLSLTRLFEIPRGTSSMEVVDLEEVNVLGSSRRDERSGRDRIGAYTLAQSFHLLYDACMSSSPRHSL